MNIDFARLLFGFSGRINRAKYWIVSLIYLVLTVVAAVVLATVLGFGAAFFAVVGIIYLVLVISGVAVAIKRLHDRNKSGWWLLVFYLLPAVLDGIGRSARISFVFSLASAAIGIWALVELGFLRGTSGPNQYGPDPLAG